MSCDSQTLPNPGILKDVQILVVDNDADSRYLHQILLETYGAQVTSLESIADAMTLLEHLIPDILICETRFFDEDVLSLIQRIRTVALGRNRKISILAVSASCSASFAQNLLAMVEAYLLKPIDIYHLVDEVYNLVPDKINSKSQYSRLRREAQSLDKAPRHGHNTPRCIA